MKKETGGCVFEKRGRWRVDQRPGMVLIRLSRLVSFETIASTLDQLGNGTLAKSMSKSSARIPSVMSSM